MSATLRIRSTTLYRVTSQVWNVLGDASHGTHGVTRIVYGARYRPQRSYDDVVEVFDVHAPRTYRLDNGHLPEFQPRADGSGVVVHLMLNPHSQAFEVPHGA